MAISVFDLFKIGIGPSSSHTVGPMVAACRFAQRLERRGLLESVTRMQGELYGSLALTGKGHGTDKAVLLGFEGELPDKVDPDAIEPTLERIRGGGGLDLLGHRRIDFDERRDLLFLRRKSLPVHPNGMRFEAFDAAGASLAKGEYYSVGGGFVLNQDEAGQDRLVPDTTRLPYPFNSGAELLRLGVEHGATIHELMLANEKVWHGEDEIRSGLLELWQAMDACVQRGLRQTGVLPGVLKVARRAPKLFAQLQERQAAHHEDPLETLDWVNLWALAVNEENAAGGRVVTAPTNGAAGILPAVMCFYRRFVPGANEEGLLRFLLTAGAIGLLYKQNASISGAEVGCQGEVGVACSMAAGGLVAAIEYSRGEASPEVVNVRVENAAEIGMEHNLGLTCDPVGGLVQIPCIERNAMGAVKAINAARIARRGDGSQKVSLDKVIKTMRETGRDMKTKYKETSRGGLALNVIEC